MIRKLIYISGRLLLSCVVFTLNACIGPYSLKDVTRQKLEFADSVQTFRLYKDRIMIPAMVNGRADTLFFDSGLFATIIKFSDGGRTGDRKLYQKTTLAPEGNVTVKYDKFIPDIENNIWHFSGCIGAECFINKNYCDDLPPTMIGYPVISFYRDSPYFLLDFSRSEIGYSGSAGKLKGYSEVPAKFERDKLQLILNINGRERTFLFDTGFGGTLLVSDTAQDTAGSSVPKRYEGALFGSVFNIISSVYKYYDAVGVSAGQAGTATMAAIYSKGVTQNIAGTGFLKHYDWIIDSRNKKVYARNRNLTSSADSFFASGKRYRSAVVGEELQIIIRKQAPDNTLPLLRPITAINGVDITPANICAYKDYLNGLPESGWEDLQITFSDKVKKSGSE